MSAVFQRLQAALGVRDVSASTRFYVEKIGFSVKATLGDPPHFALLERDAVTMSLVRADPPAVADFACCYLYVDDVEAAHRDCAARGVTIVNPLIRHPWGTHDFVLVDPDGHRIAIGTRTATGDH